jgi:hypothetical protein
MAKFRVSQYKKGYTVMPILTINQSKLLHSLEFAFAEKNSVISELLQNCKRANATQIDIHYSGDELVVSDNGEGITDFDIALFTLAESAWKKSVLRENSPYGIGFLSCLYSAKKVTVISNNQEVSFDSHSALNGKHIPINTHHYSKGTIVILTGINLVEVGKTIEEYVKGFPVNVTFNGEQLERPYALDSNKKFIETSIGQISFSGKEGKPETWSISSRYRLYLQGLPIANHNYSKYDNANIIHLNNTFKGILPDRKDLHEKKEAYQRIDEVINEHWSTFLDDQIPQLTDEQLCDIYELVKKMGKTEVYNHCSLIPRVWLHAFNDAPRIDREYEYHDYLEHPDNHVPIEQFTNKSSLLLEMMAFDNYEWGDVPLQSLWHFAYLKDAYMLNSLPNSDHPLSKCVIEPEEVHKTKITCKNPRKKLMRSSDWFAAFDIILCDSYELVYRGMSIKSNEHAFWSEDLDALIIPALSEGENAYGYMSSFNTEYNHDETAENNEYELLKGFIRNNRYEQVEDLIKTIMDNQIYQYIEDDLIGQEFKITIGELHKEGVSIVRV